VSVPIPREQLLNIRRVLVEMVPNFMQRRNVVACGIGHKIKGEEQTDIPGLIVSVTRKEPPEALSLGDLIPRAVGDVPVDVVETGAIAAHGLNRCAALRPARPGMSVGHPGGNIGTIGAIVRRGEQHFILSNNHVLALLNQASPGDPIWQPAPGDGGTSADQVAELADFVPLRFLSEDGTSTDLAPESEEAPGCAAQLAKLLNFFVEGVRNLNRTVTALPAPPSVPENHVDAALARAIDSALLDPNIVDLGGPPRGIAPAQLGMPVVKSGRTSGVTEGKVLQVDVTVNVRYGDRQARFTDQIMVSPISRLGDSGSLVVDHERRAVALLFAGSEQVTVVSPIDFVLRALNVELITQP
jgi:hypothetical protein